MNRSRPQSERQRRRQVILGLVAVLWGGALILRGLLNEVPSYEAGAYQAGGFAAFLFAFVFIAVGARALIKARR